MPPVLPQVEPDAAALRDTVFVAITVRDPAEPVYLMGFLTRRWDGEAFVPWAATPEHIEADIAASWYAPNVVSWRIVRYADIPKDRTYRDAWTHDGTTLVHDLAKVRRIAVEHVRQDRVLAFLDLDAQYARATGQRDTKAAAAIEARRQRLRDLPAVTAAALAQAQTVEDVQALRPDVAAIAGQG